MKKAIALEKLLKPPFYLEGRYLNIDVEDGTTRCLAVMQENFSKYDFGEDIYDQIDDFFVAALNEKTEREFGEPMRWVEYSDMIICPKCKDSYNKKQIDYCSYEDVKFSLFKHCPSCGKRLLPPDWEGE